MHITNLPLVFTSMMMMVPYFTAVSVENYWTAGCWGALTTSSILVHMTKIPYHIHGPGNAVPWLEKLDNLFIYMSAARALMDGWYGGPIAFTMSVVVLSYASLVFHAGQYYNTFVFERTPHIYITFHGSVHLLSAMGGTAVILLRAFYRNLV